MTGSGGECVGDADGRNLVITNGIVDRRGLCDSGGRDDGYSGYGQFNDHECNGSEDLYGRE